ncbi:hypothetical protein FEM48_Zijuj07G0051800 [Ziziphus jujuba var. spinosa]|uniref:Heat stress transcription factor A-5-like n=1 Tax=Ziziphus jujuba var. spinosa TaxID=714518 RepID=A0A978V2N1_ZIZJJ|nr:hypothetical protein FEM48_Zijuj07G0051800 [Ziziphus jujuba var. spinosa]
MLGVPLNAQGFRKIDPERWEFANEDFIKDQKHLLKNIHRRKPIHSHSHPPGTLVDPERAALDDEIEKLSREKAALESNVSSFQQQRSAAKLQLGDMLQRVSEMERRQESLLNFLEKAVQNPIFVERLARKIEAMDFTAYNKKRRLPEVDHPQPVLENNFVDNHISSRAEFGNIFHQDFSSKLRLELSPAVSDINLVSHSTQSSNEDGESPHRKVSEGEFRGAQRTEGLFFPAEALELSDTGTSFAFKMDSSLSRKSSTNGRPGLQLSQPNLPANEEGEGRISCHLNLTLASTPLQFNNSPYSARMPQQGHETSEPQELNKNMHEEEKLLSSSQEAAKTNQEPVAAPVKVNDVFWEQFLTERPGCSENEEASSNYRANSYDEQDDRKLGHGISRNVKNVEQLSL